MARSYPWANHRGGAGSRAAPRPMPILAFGGQPPMTKGQVQGLLLLDLLNRREAKIARNVLKRHVAGKIAEVAIEGIAQYLVPPGTALHPVGSYHLRCDIGGIGQFLSKTYAGDVCNTGQYIEQPGTNPPTADSLFVSECTPNDISPPVPNGIVHRVWERDFPAFADPEFVAEPVPEGLPVVQTVPVPKPLFYPRPGVRPRPTPRPNPLAPPELVPEFAPPLVEYPPVVAWQVAPNGRMRPVNAPPHRISPPAPREREKKAGVVGGILTGISAVTEGFDVIDAVYGGLPDDIKPPGFMSPYDKLKFAIDNWEMIDVKKAIGNMIINEAKDRLIAAFGARGINPQTGLPFRGGGPTRIGGGLAPPSGA